MTAGIKRSCARASNAPKNVFLVADRNVRVRILHAEVLKTPSVQGIPNFVVIETSPFRRNDLFTWIETKGMVMKVSMGGPQEFGLGVER